MSTIGSAPKNWLGFSYISSEYYELDLNFYEREMKTKAEKSPNKNKSLHKNVVVIEEQFFSDMN